MTFRAVVRDGMINVNTHGALPDGTVVEVLTVARAPASRKANKARTPKPAKTKKETSPKANPLLDLAGIWKDRPDWKGKSTLEIHRQLRARAIGGGRRG